MLANHGAFSICIRVVAPLVWKGDARIAAKLLDFSATEAGSALDMLKAAELSLEPEHRRLFFRHAMDEARHAQLFRAAAAELATRGTGREFESRISEYSSIRARRLNLFHNLGRDRFLAFVCLAERRGYAHFLALRAHFRGRPELEALFARIAKEEVFHCKYSARLLGTGPSPRRAFAYARVMRAWNAWRRMGRQIGDRVAQALLVLLYLTAVPPFALLERWLKPARTGWKERTKIASPVDARRPY